jgi:flagellar M-ring protein FliF
MADGGFDIRSIINQIKRVFQGLTTIQKSMVAAITAVLFVAFLGLIIFANQERMAVLHSDLNTVDANAMVEHLKKNRIRHELSSDNRTIYVPEKQVSRLRLMIAGEGILSGEKLGFEKLESPGLTTTDFSMRTSYRLAQQNALEKTLREGLPHLIKNAKVTITPAKESVFVADKEESKAAVLLTLISNRVPPEENTVTIMNLVASAVEGLKPENVVISDQYARQLNKRDTQAKVTDNQRRMQRDEEDYLVEKVREQLEPAVGIGKVMASARVELDFDKVKITEDLYDPQGQVERAVQTHDEKSTRREPPLGIPGTPTNVAPADAQADGGNIWETKDIKDSITNYEISNTYRVTEKSPGSIKRVTISVLLDEKTVWEKDAKGNFEKKPVPWGTEDLEKFRKLVVGATGIDNARGDIVTVDSLSFAPTANPQEEVDARRQYWLDLARVLSPFAIILIGFIGWLVYKFITRPKEIPAEETALIQVEELEDEGDIMEEKPQAPKTLAELKAEIEAEINAENAENAPEQQRREIIKERIIEIVASDPETAASLVRTWLIDEEGGKA